MTEMNCSELVRRITDYLEVAMARTERRRLEAHLDRCARCLEYLREMRRTIVVVGRLRSWR